MLTLRCLSRTTLSCFGYVEHKGCFFRLLVRPFRCVCAACGKVYHRPNAKQIFLVRQSAQSFDCHDVDLLGPMDFSCRLSLPSRRLHVQLLHLWVAAAARGTLSLLFQCRWEPLVAGAACPLLVLGIGELLKRNDARVYNRYITLLRLEFDTRLGMHSPR